MKKPFLLTLLATTLATTAPAAITAGLEAGYLLDNQDAYWAGRVGWEFKSTATFSHQVELEYGSTEHSESVSPVGPITGTIKIQPLTINYRAQSPAANRLGYYFGIGAGRAETRVGFDGTGLATAGDRGFGLVGQAFAGVNYQFTPVINLHAGVKYLWIDDVELFEGDVEVGDDFALTAALNFRF